MRARNSVIGENVYVGRGTVIEDSLLLGNAVYTSEQLRTEAIARGERVYGVGECCAALPRVLGGRHALARGRRGLPRKQGGREPGGPDR